MLRAPSTDGVTVVVHELAGSAGHPVVLIAHATGFHGHAYLPVAKRLAPRFHTFGMDFRGHGDTALPARLVGVVARVRRRRARSPPKPSPSRPPAGRGPRRLRPLDGRRRRC